VKSLTVPVDMRAMGEVEARGAPPLAPRRRVGGRVSPRRKLRDRGRIRAKCSLVAELSGIQSDKVGDTSSGLAADGCPVHE